MNLNYENHRISKDSELTCETCLAFDSKKNKCNHIETVVGTTLKHNTCRYHYSLHNLSGLKRKEGCGKLSL